MVFKIIHARGVVVCDDCDKTLLTDVAPENAPHHGEHVCRDCADGRHIKKSLRLRKAS